MSRTKEVGRVLTATSSRRLPDLTVVRILLVDDDPQAAALIDIALADAPFERVIEVATTLSRGIARVDDDAHDIYLIDQQLPDGTGIELIRRARAGATSKPFILLTGYGSGDIDREASLAGAADYVEKHMVAAQLERSIRYALRNWQAGRMLHDREEQLRQAQKMEAIGRLAGGVAHDFNNLLTAIIGYADLITERLDASEQSSPIAREVAEIRRAADRASGLTRQLLAFSRKQFLSPTILNLNDTASGLLQMLPRVIGDHIRTTAQLSDDLARVKADSSQMEQVFLNLVLNARDAMPMGGQLTIRTANVDVDDDILAAESLSIPPGRYAMLSIGDTGTGMDSATRDRAFEPFFTTKPKGKGTGFGLATVYGIIDQSGGAIYLDTALGRGTTVRIYLPATEAAVEPRKPELPAATADRGTETLLVVEDNDSVRGLAVKALRRRGYTVFEAGSGEEAIDWALSSGIKVHLLVTDVVMPGLSGPHLAARLSKLNPALRVLYVSGYTDDASALHGTSPGDVPFLQKPFTPSMLAQRIRSILDSPE
ncbi:MAG TPA: response regulator [Vicinamibacterales bacterium]|nr:response regulator [Vicinamibacterales bacterium]